MENRFSAVGPRYRDAQGVLRVKAPPMPKGQYRDALGVLRQRQALAAR